MNQAGTVILGCVALILISCVSGRTDPDRAQTATVTVDSSFRGYSAAVLNDGQWIAPGEETTTDYGSPDRLGNAGNSWVSAADVTSEHWVRLDWPDQVSVAGVELWWTQESWWPRAFRVEYLSDQSWVPLLGPEAWFAATQRCSTVSWQPIQTSALRIVQAPGGSADRGLMAMQEVRVFAEAPAGALSGARALSPAEVARLRPAELARNIARLHEEQPGASRAIAWVADRELAVPGLADGVRAPAGVPTDAEAVGVQWPIQHVIDGLAVFRADGPDAAGALSIEIRSEGTWFPVMAGLTITAAEGRQIASFEPVACDAVRARGGHLPAVSELEVLRYQPAGPHHWPERLVDGDAYAREILALSEEPSFERLSSAALSMRPTWALLGLKDARDELAVDWDGTIFAGATITFEFGEDRVTFGDYPDTLTRTLLDGWLPATVVHGQLGELAVEQTAFVCFADEQTTQPRLFVRTAMSRDAEVAALVAGEERLVHRVGEGPVLLQSWSLDGELSATSLTEDEWEAALGRLRRYWDALLPRQTWIDLPEGRLNRLQRAVLTQLLINADGDIMPYGSRPGAYEGQLYGVEEGFAMMALAQFGLADDAARYMDGTYLTEEFMRKVEEYSGYGDRHQQYRNGLQPMYAIELYRLTGDRRWIDGHLDLIRDAAEWTIEQRRRTMVEEGGERPLHWGLLPKWSYGGDIAGLQCHALYPNFACWRGMLETAWLMERLGDEEAARRYRDEAADYREVLDRVVDASYREEHEPPFLPLRVYGEEPVGDDYYQLFAGTLLHLFPFDLSGHRVGWVTDFLEEDNLVFCLMPRFRRDVGPGGLDGLYGLGYMLTRLHQDRVEEFLLGFYAYLAFNLERETFAARETNLLYASDLHVRSEYRVPDISDPVPCSAAVPLLLLRAMLVTEEVRGGALPGPELKLLHGAPRRWFADGERIRFRQMPTAFGEVSCEVTSRVGEGRIEAVVLLPKREPWEAVRLRLRHPEGTPMRAVTVNGRPWTEFDAEREVITLRPGADSCRVVVSYERGAQSSDAAGG